MPYDYAAQRVRLFTDDGQRLFIKFRDRALVLTATAGAVRMDKLMMAGDTWDMLACADRMVELGELREIGPESVPGQHRVFVRGAPDNG